MIKKILMGMFLTSAVACSGGGGGSGGSSSTGPSIDTPPSSSIPTSPASNNSAAGGAGSGTCGLNGTFGICQNYSMGDTQSVKVYSIVSNCNTVTSKFTFYTGTNCGGSQYYERTRSYTMNVIGDSSSITGAKDVTMTLTSITQEFFTAATSGTHQADYMFCDSDDSTYVSTPKQTKTGSACYASHSSSLSDYNILKVTTDGMYVGNASSCTGYNQECLSGQRPTALETTGVPVWQ